MSKFNDLKYNQRVARDLEKQGIEITPEQVKSERSDALRKIREQLSDLNPPKDDEELMLWFGALLAKGAVKPVIE